MTLDQEYGELVEMIAKELIQEAAEDIEYLTIVEKLSDKGYDHVLSEEDFDDIAGRIDDLIPQAKVIVKFGR